MISLQVITPNTEAANQITDFLLREKLILEGIIHNKVMFKELGTTGVTTSSKVLITGLTKALLFEKISEELKSRFADFDLTLHALPIVYMDWERQKVLVQKVENV